MRHAAVDGALERLLAEYYNYLAVNLWQGRRDPKFWDLHKRKLTDSGVGFSRPKLLGAALTRLRRALLNPGETRAKLFYGMIQISLLKIRDSKVFAERSTIGRKF